MGTDNISSDLLEKAMACETDEELQTLCESSGFALSNEELTDVAGGSFAGPCTPWCMSYFPPCPKNMQ